MAVTDLFAGEIATELLKCLLTIAKKSCSCRSTAEQFIATIHDLLPIIQEIKYAGVELPPNRQFQLDDLSQTLREGLELARKVLASSRWNIYQNLQYLRKMERLEKRVKSFLKIQLPAHLLADVHHLRFESEAWFQRIYGSAPRLEQRLGSMKIGIVEGEAAGEWLVEAMMKTEEEARWCEDGLVNLGAAMALGKKKLKEMLLSKHEAAVIGIRGIGGSGKTTLAREICRDEDVICYFKNRILFLTVSQSPNVEQLKAKISGHIMRNNFCGSDDLLPPLALNVDWRIEPQKTLVILDDVWSLSVLDQLASFFKIPGCKALVVSRFKFPTLLEETYKLELLREEEAVSLFCYFAFGQKSIPPSANEKLVKQLVNECKGLPLALKVIGASLRGQPEMFWTSAKSRLTRCEPINESHETMLERMAISVSYLPEKVGECFLDLGSFPEDKKVPLDVLINIWVELHDLDEEEAYAILVELSDKNLLTLTKEPRAGEMYSSCYEISVCQHDVLRDLSIHLSNHGGIKERRRLLMPRRETGIPREWGRNADQPFNAQIVSFHTGDMDELDWPHMAFPKTEVLVLNFASEEYFLPTFIDSMPNLRALVIINYGNSVATLRNFTILSQVTNLRSLWLEKITIPPISEATAPLRSLCKVSLVLCRITETPDRSATDLPSLFPSLLELSMDHCDGLIRLPPSVCRLRFLRSLSVTNCSLAELPADLGLLSCSLLILRVFACPAMKKLPSGICELAGLVYLDISQCVGMVCLPERIGELKKLEKIDMRECRLLRNLPRSAASLQALRRVVCDESIAWFWRHFQQAIPGLHVQVAEECFNLDWLTD